MHRGAAVLFASCVHTDPVLLSQFTICAAGLLQCQVRSRCGGGVLCSAKCLEYAIILDSSSRLIISFDGFVMG